MEKVLLVALKKKVLPPALLLNLTIDPPPEEKSLVEIIQLFVKLKCFKSNDAFTISRK